MANIMTLSRISPIFGAILACMVVAILDPKHDIKQTCLMKSSSKVYDHVSWFYFQIS